MVARIHAGAHCDMVANQLLKESLPKPEQNLKKAVAAVLLIMKNRRIILCLGGP